MTTFEKIGYACSWALVGLGVALAAISWEPEPIEPYCPTRDECWATAALFADITVRQVEATCTYAVDERAWHRETQNDFYTLRSECDDACGERIGDLYDALVSAELEPGFEPYYPEDQLLCDCVSGLIANPDLSISGDVECLDAMSHVCRGEP